MSKITLSSPECYGALKYYRVIATIETEDEEVEVSCSVSVSSSEDLEEYVETVTVVDTSDLPDDVTEEEIEELIKDQWDNL